MTKKQYEEQKRKCQIAENKLHSECASFAIMLQPYFKEEIIVLYQPSDGFVVFIDTITITHYKIDAAQNLPIDEVFETIQSNPKFYLC